MKEGFRSSIDKAFIWKENKGGRARALCLRPHCLRQTNSFEASSVVGVQFYFYEMPITMTYCVSCITRLALLPRQQEMNQIPSAHLQSLAEHLITEPPDTKLAQCLPQPRLEHLGRSLLLRDNANGRLKTRLRRLFTRGLIHRPETTDLGTGAHERGDQGFIIDAIAGKKKVEASVFFFACIMFARF